MSLVATMLKEELKETNSKHKSSTKDVYRSIQGSASRSNHYQHNNSFSSLRYGKTNCSCDGGCPVCVRNSTRTKSKTNIIPFIQTKLNVSHPHDPYEQEADRISELVLNGQQISNDETTVQKIGSKCPICRSRKIQNNEIPILSKEPNFRDSEFHNIEPSYLRDSIRIGSEIDHNSRKFMEKQLGADFSNVTIHTDSFADESARSLGARAFTINNDIFFEKGGYSPNTRSGKKLLAHELVHVIQQRGAMGNNIFENYPTESSQLVGAHLAMLPKSGSNVLQRSIKEDSPSPCGGSWKCAVSPCEKPDPGYEGNGGEASSWTLKLMIDIEAPSAEDVTSGANVGHTYVELSDSTGRIYTYGFYPDKSSGTPDPFFKPFVAGCMVHPDVSHKNCVDYTERFDLNNTEFQSALSFAQLFCKSPPKYNLQTYNCTTFAKDVAEKAGRSLPPIRGKVGRLIEADNPNTLIENLRRRDAGPTYKLTSDSEIRNVIANASKLELSHAHANEKIRVINVLLDGWVSDDDIAAIEKLCDSVSSSKEMDQIKREVSSRENDLWNESQKKRFHAAIGQSPLL